MLLGMRELFRNPSNMDGVVCFVQGSFSVISSFFRQFALRRRFLQFAALTTASACLTIALSGCSKLRPKPPAQYVYVTAKQTFLRDRVAAVSNRTATVGNGDKLEVLEHGRRFIRVQTEKGEQGWIDEKVVATQEIFDQFDTLKQQHKDDPTVASAVVRDEVYLHAAPGRDTERFYRLAEGEKLKLLARATLPKPLPPGLKAVAKPDAAGKGPAVPETPVMEDWWLVRDSKGDTGWLYSRMMDVDAPDAITRYAEGQRIVGAYVLTTVNDPDAEQEDKNIPIYVTVMSPYKAGLTYDYDQVRVFTWSLKKHRYETGFRDKNIEGFLPVTIKLTTDPNGKSPTATTPLPTFTYRVLADDSGPVIPDPVTGAIVPGKTILKTYRLEGNYVHRIVAPGTSTGGEAHPAPPEKKKDAPKSKKRR
jgi:hypothetical protein